VAWGEGEGGDHIPEPDPTGGDLQVDARRCLGRHQRRRRQRIEIVSWFRPDRVGSVFRCVRLAAARARRRLAEPPAAASMH
jgi:hypothetical protein